MHTNYCTLLDHIPTPYGAAAHAMARSLARVGEVELREMVSGLHMVASC